jgi:ribonuclease HI
MQSDLQAEAEAMGLLEVLRWLNNTNRTTTPIVIETDCMQVAKAILAKPVNRTEFGSIIEMCLRLLVEFDNCQVSFVRRQANRVAHELAQATRVLASPQVYNFCPPYIEPIIMNEMH